MLENFYFIHCVIFLNGIALIGVENSDNPTLEGAYIAHLHYSCPIIFADVDLKVASKFFASRFACGSSVTGGDEIVIQGDVKDDLFDVIPEKFKHVRQLILDKVFLMAAQWSELGLFF